MIHVHLFGNPGEIHIHLSLTRISFKAYKIQFGILSKPLFSFPSPVDFDQLKAARSSLIMLSLGRPKGSRQLNNSPAILFGDAFLPFTFVYEVSQSSLHTQK